MGSSRGAEVRVPAGAAPGSMLRGPRGGEGGGEGPARTRSQPPWAGGLRRSGASSRSPPAPLRASCGSWRPKGSGGEPHRRGGLSAQERAGGGGAGAGPAHTCVSKSPWLGGAGSQGSPWRARGGGSIFQRRGRAAGSHGGRLPASPAPSLPRALVGSACKPRSLCLSPPAPRPPPWDFLSPHQVCRAGCNRTRGSPSPEPPIAASRLRWGSAGREGGRARGERLGRLLRPPARAAPSEGWEPAVPGTLGSSSRERSWARSCLTPRPCWDAPKPAGC